MAEAALSCTLGLPHICFAWHACRRDAWPTPWSWRCHKPPGLRPASLCWCPPCPGTPLSRALGPSASGPHCHSQTGQGLKPVQDTENMKGLRSLRFSFPDLPCGKLLYLVQQISESYAVSFTSYNTMAFYWSHGCTKRSLFHRIIQFILYLIILYIL